MSKGIKIVKSAEVTMSSGQTGRAPGTRRQKVGWSVLVAAVAVGLALVPALITAQGNEVSTVTLANGGACESVRTVSDDFDYSIAEAPGFGLVPNMSLAVPDVTANGKDLLLITFSAESYLVDASDSGDLMMIEARVDGVTVYTTGFRPAFAGTPSHYSSSKQWAIKVPAGAHTVEIFVDLVDIGTNDVLVGHLDDSTLTVTRHN